MKRLLATLIAAAFIAPVAAHAGNSMTCTGPTGKAYTAQQVGGKIKLKSPVWSANLTITGEAAGVFFTKRNAKGISTVVMFGSSGFVTYHNKAGIAYQHDLCQASRAPSTPRAYSVLDGIKSKCTGEWPGDYAMQKFCIDRQVKAFNELQGY